MTKGAVAGEAATCSCVDAVTGEGIGGLVGCSIETAGATGAGVDSARGITVEGEVSCVSVVTGEGIGAGNAGDTEGLGAALTMIVVGLIGSTVEGSDSTGTGGMEGERFNRYFRSSKSLRVSF